MSFDPLITSILLLDPYSDFLSEHAKLWPRAKATAGEPTRPSAGNHEGRPRKGFQGVLRAPLPLGARGLL
jgi:hypothetical protein